MTLIALDGTEFHCSDKIRGPNCSHRQRERKGVEYFHTLLAATIVAPGHNRAVPLEPEFVAPQDGHEKQDCESRAARRWLAAHGIQYAALKPIYLGDDLVLSTYITPLTTSRMFTVRLPPPRFGGGINGLISCHSALVRSLG